MRLVVRGPERAFGVCDEKRDLYFFGRPSGLVAPHFLHRADQDVLRGFQHVGDRAIAQGLRAGIGEHAANKLRRVLAIFRLPQRPDERLDLLRFQVERAQRAIDRNQPGDLVRKIPVVPADHRRSHTVADQRGLPDLGVAQHGINGAGEEVHAVSRRRFVALSVAGQVEENQSRLVRERRDLELPEADVPAPAMDKDHRLLSCPERDVVDLVRAEPGEVRLGFRERIRRRRGCVRAQGA